MTERIYHLALARNWADAVEAGAYTISSLGVTLAEEGFIHASRADQWEATRARYYGDVTEPLVLLVIDPARLTAPLVVERAASGETFPHLYGPLNLDAVVEVRDLTE